MRKFYMVAYDISDNRRRGKVAKFLEGWGDRVQYSVFCCQLNAREKLRLCMEINKFLNAKEDQAILIDAGPVKGQHPLPESVYLGRPWEPEERSQIV